MPALHLPVVLGVAAGLALGVRAAAQILPSPSDVVSQDSLASYLRSLPTKRAAMGDLESQRGLAETERLLERTLRELGLEPRLEPIPWNLKEQRALLERFKRESPGVEPAGVGPWAIPESDPEHENRTWHNIVVEFKGTRSPKEVLIVSGHFDAVPGSPGADDDGTGVAAVLELARVFKGRTHDKTLRLVFFNLEEVGLRGSREMARRLKPSFDDGTEKLVGMASLEMLGFYTDAPGSQKSPIPAIEGVFQPPTVGDFIAIVTVNKYTALSTAWEKAMVAAAPGLKTLRTDFFPPYPLTPPDVQRSDHAPFLWIHQPALMLTDTANFRNPNYHKATDTVETLDLPRFTLTVRGVAGAVAELVGVRDEPGGDIPAKP